MADKETHPDVDSSPSGSGRTRAASIEARADNKVSLKDLPREPEERGRIATFILLLTFCAGWADFLAFLFLGHVFSSFLTGDLLFIGAGVSLYYIGSTGLLPRAVIAVVVYLGLTTLTGAYLQRGSSQHHPKTWNKRMAIPLAVEWVFLLAYAIVWYFANPAHFAPAVPNYTQILLLGLAAVAMGIQGAIINSFNIPGVLANALTGSVISLGWRLGQAANRPQAINAEWKYFNALRIGSFVIYIVAAFLVESISKVFFTPAIPVVAVTLAFIPLAWYSRHSERRPLQENLNSNSIQRTPENPVHWSQKIPVGS